MRESKRGLKLFSALLISAVAFTVILTAGCAVQPDSPEAKAGMTADALTADAFSANDYATVLAQSVQFFDANKCGPNVVSSGNVYSWRGACHTTDGSDVGKDLTGGYHDAGDHVKFGLPQGYAASVLGWALYEFGASFDKAGNKAKMLSTLKYFTDYFLRSHPNATTLYYQVGDGDADHAYWGAPETQTGARNTLYYADASHAASDVCGQTAAALILMYLNYKNIDATYANKCLQAGREIYAMGKATQGYGNGQSFYQSGSWSDDLAWAAVWLGVVDGISTMKSEIDSLMAIPNKYGDNPAQNKWTMCWDNMYLPVYLKMAQLAGDQKYKDGVAYNFDYWKNTLAKTPAGLRYLNNWGVLRYTAAESMNMLVYYKLTGDVSLYNFAKSQVDYIMGTNPNNFSYVIGFGSKYCLHPHHRAANGYTYANGGNLLPAKYLITGALVGGPDMTDTFKDSGAEYQYTEVAIDYNAGFVGAMAGILAYADGPISSTSSTAVSSKSSSSVSSTIVTSSSSSTSYGTGTGKPYAYGLPGVFNDQDAYLQAQYTEWKGQYVTASGAGGALRVQRDSGTQFDTVSEGIGYGMLLAVLYKDQTTFNGLYAYYKKYLNANGFMHWQIDQYGNVIGQNGATDSDEDVALSLCFASKVWGSAGSVNYGQEATSMINKIMSYEVESGSYVLKPGDMFGGSSTFNPSYFAPSFYRVFKAHTGDARWDNVIAAGYAILDKIQAFNAGTGFSPDWCTAAGQNCGKSYDLGYDAIRVPFRIGLDWSWNGNTQARDINNKFIKFFDSKGTTNTLRDGYTLTGTVLGQWWTPTFAAMVASASMSTNNITVARKWYDISKNKQDPYSNAYHYFGSCLRMLNLTYMSGNFQNLYDGVISSSSSSSVSVTSSSKSSVSSAIVVSSSSKSSSSTSTGPINMGGRMTGVNWFGFETANGSPHGLWTRDYKSMLKQMKDLGFNTIRLPFCHSVFTGSPNGIQVNADGVDAYTGIRGMNIDLGGLTSIQVMDKIIQEAGTLGLRIVLDYHSKAPDAYLNETLWYTTAIGESVGTADWVALANRYKNQANVVAADLKNEPHGNTISGMTPPATWGYDEPGYGVTDWKAAAERIGQAILAVAPHWIIIVEGVETYRGQSYWWGGNLLGVKDYPITGIPKSNLWYSAHEYGPEVYPQTWFTDPTFPANMPAIWEKYFWFIESQGIAPVFFGEFGIKEASIANSGSVAAVWFKEFMKLMGKRCNWTFWCWNANSGDTGGILQNDWVTVEPTKYATLKPYLAMYDGNSSSSFSYQSQSSVSSVSSKSSIVTSSSKSSSSSVIVVSSSSSSQMSVARQNIPGKIEAESYNAMSGIQTEACAEGTLNVGWVDSGDWMDYYVNATSGGTYNLELRVADQFSSGKIDFIVDGTTLASVSIPNTGGWQTWTSINTPVTIAAGTHTIRILASASPWNLNYFNLTKTGSSSSSVVSSKSSIKSSSSVVVSSSSSKSSSSSSSVIVTGNVKVQMFNGSTTATGNAINPRFNLVNTGTTAVTLSTVKIRYFYTIDGVQAQTFWCDWSPVGSGNITGTFTAVSPAKTGADYCLEVGFTSGAGSLAPGASVEIQTRSSKNDWSNFNQSNDYSFNPSATSYVDWTKTPAYVSGVLQWGVAP